ncbi:MAG: hypothetical protein QOH26_1864 [Actinomycetota bacterium]|jgi:hypothetical protein|nr:hypothetical protein [Actinomycetota bacterium]
MILAHSIGTSGPDIEFLMLAVALVVLAVVLFVQKTAKPFVPVLLLVGAIGFSAGAFAVGGSPTTAGSGKGITVVIKAPDDGDVVPAGKSFKVEVKLTGASIVTGVTNGPSEGHFHVYVDGDLVAMPATITPDVTLQKGRHTVTVEFTDSNHAPFSPRILDEVELIAK